MFPRTSTSTDATPFGNRHALSSVNRLWESHEEEDQLLLSAIHRDGGSNPRDTSSTQVRRPPRSDFDLIAYVDQTLDALHGKWKVHLLFFMARGIHRHSRLLDCLPASKKVMTDTLRALERDGLVCRTVFAEVPVRVEYSLTPLGWTITQPLITLAEWGEEHASEVARDRSLYRFGRDVREPNPPQRPAAA
jgi:DNA-binding HxlR family transcriptional regulator